MPVKLRHIMKHTLAGACAALFIFSGQTVFAGSVQEACFSAGSSKSNYRVCRCIQSATDATLSVKDQSLAAGIIRNPDNVTENKILKTTQPRTFHGAVFAIWRIGAGLCSWSKRRTARL